MRTLWIRGWPTRRSKSLPASMLLLAMGFSVLAGGCRRTRVFAAPPAVSNEVRVEVLRAAAKGANFEARLMIYNHLNREIIVDLNHIAVVVQEGDFYRMGGRHVYPIKPQGRRGVKLHVRLPVKASAKNLPGLYLRLDGIYDGYSRLSLPAIALGEPPHSAGQVNLALQSPAETERRDAAPTVLHSEKKSSPNIFRRVVNKVAHRVAGSTASKPDADEPTAGIQYYTGPRRRIRTAGTRCAAMPMNARDLSEGMASIVDDLLLAELQHAGFEAIGPDDVNAMLGLEQMKDSMGCDDVACGVEIGNALGVDHLVSGSVAILESGTVVTLKIIDVRQTRVLSRANRISDGQESTLPRLIAEAVQDVVARSSL